MINICWINNYETVLDLDFNFKLKRRDRKKVRKSMIFTLSLMNPNVLKILTADAMKNLNYTGDLNSLIPENMKNLDVTKYIDSSINLDMIAGMLGTTPIKVILFATMCVLILMFSAVYDLFVKAPKVDHMDYKYKETDAKTITKEILIILISMLLLFVPVWLF